MTRREGCGGRRRRAAASGGNWIKVLLIATIMIALLILLALPRHASARPCWNGAWLWSECGGWVYRPQSGPEPRGVPGDLDMTPLPPLQHRTGEDAVPKDDKGTQNARP